MGNSKTKALPKDKSLDNLIKYENGDMSFDEEIDHFQELINSGKAWQLQGSTGRQAMALVEEGYCMLGEVGHKDYYGNYVPSRYEVKPGTKGSKEYCEQKQQERNKAAA